MNEPTAQFASVNHSHTSARKPGQITPVAIVAVMCCRGGTWETLMRRRGHGTHLAGLWELPGGKIRTDENPRDAARRELLEETSLAVDTLWPLCEFTHAYADRTIRLWAYACEVDAQVGQYNRIDVSWSWHKTDRLQALHGLPDANRTIAAALVERYSRRTVDHS